MRGPSCAKFPWSLCGPQKTPHLLPRGRAFLPSLLIGAAKSRDCRHARCKGQKIPGGNWFSTTPPEFPTSASYQDPQVPGRVGPLCAWELQILGPSSSFKFWKPLKDWNRLKLRIMDLSAWRHRRVEIMWWNPMPFSKVGLSASKMVRWGKYGIMFGCFFVHHLGWLSWKMWISFCKGWIGTGFLNWITMIFLLHDWTARIASGKWE